MIGLLSLLGCAPTLFPSRVLDCDSIDRIEGDTLELISNVSPDGACRLEVEGGRLRERTLEDPRWVRLYRPQGGLPTTLTLAWDGALTLIDPVLQARASGTGELVVDPEVLQTTGMVEVVVRRPTSLSVQSGTTTLCHDTQVEAGVDPEGRLVVVDHPWVLPVASDVPLEVDASPAAISRCCADLGTTCPPRPVDTGEPSGPAGCETCHQAIEDAHPWVQVDCTTCHGGNPEATTAADAHVARPALFTEDALTTLDGAWFRYRTLVSPPSLGPLEQQVDWLAFRNPGDLRVGRAGAGCGTSGCHADLVQTVSASLMSTAAGVLSTPRQSAGLPHRNGVSGPGETNSLADTASRRIARPPSGDPGTVELLSPLNTTDGTVPVWDAIDLDDDVDALQRVIAGSDLEEVIDTSLALACTDCHLESAGLNDRAGRYRSSGCTACHMPTALDGRSQSADETLDHLEPANPDAITSPERPHVVRHRLVSVADGLGSGGIPDQACAACHSGTNATVLQYWGIRIDTHRAVSSGTAFLGTPQSWESAEGDERLFPPGFGNTTVFGYTSDQLLTLEDHDADGRDDTPPDVHAEAGMGCIDCHGGADTHGRGMLLSKQSQAVGVTCESCHGTIAGPPPTMPCEADTGEQAVCTVDRFGRPLRNVTLDGQGYVALRGRLDGVERTVPLVQDVVDADRRLERLDPRTGASFYNERAAYAMGRIDDTLANGRGPEQSNPTLGAQGFAHGDSVGCAACHAAWTQNCIGCHVDLTVDDDPSFTAFSPATGERTLLRASGTVGLQSPLFKSLIVDDSGRIEQGQPGSKWFTTLQDAQGSRSPTFAFSDRRGFGNRPDLVGQGPLPALAHNRIAQHTIRGRPTDTAEGVNNCSVCHLNTASVPAFDDPLHPYTRYRTGYLQTGIADPLFVADQLGSFAGNTQNQRNEAVFVAMTAGLGTGLLQADADGCLITAGPADGLDACLDGLPAYDLDRIVEVSGIENVSASVPLRAPSVFRDGARQPLMAGPLGASLVERLTHPTVGIVLDSWIDADGEPRGDATLSSPESSP